MQYSKRVSRKTRTWFIETKYARSSALVRGEMYFFRAIAETCSRALQRSLCRARDRAMPLPVAEEGIAGFLQRSENRRNSVSPNDSPGTAKRAAEGEWLSKSLPRLRLCYAVVMLTGGGFPFHLVHFSIAPGFPACPAFPPPATLPS